MERGKPWLRRGRPWLRRGKPWPRRGRPWLRSGRPYPVKKRMHSGGTDSRKAKMSHASPPIDVFLLHQVAIMELVKASYEHLYSLIATNVKSRRNNNLFSQDTPLDIRFPYTFHVIIALRCGYRVGCYVWSAIVDKNKHFFATSDL